MPLISHRGADSLAPENSIEGIKIADTFSPSYIEIDVNCTADYQLIIGHGPLKQEATGIVLDHTFAEYKAKNPQVALLQDVLRIKLKAPFMFDIKTSEASALKAIRHTITKSKVKDFIFTSPHQDSLDYMQKHFPKAKVFVTQTYHTSPIKAIEAARKHNLTGISLSKWQSGPVTMMLSKYYKKSVNIYTVDSAFLMWLLQRLYPQAMIITNKPQLYRRLFPTE